MLPAPPAVYADDLVAALTPVAAAFNRLGVRHYIGGSVASTWQGAIRSSIVVKKSIRFGGRPIW